MRVLIVCCAILACAAYVSADKCTTDQYAKYLEYKKQFGKNDVSKNEDEKCSIWLKSVADVKACNANPKTHDCAINMMSDLTDAEKTKYFGYTNPTPKSSVLQLRSAADKPPTISAAAAAALPASVDWRVKGFVSPVKNQGGCGSCWAFSATGVIEGQAWAKSKQMITLSEQQLVDCVYGYGGCNGGWMMTAYQYIQNAGGLFKNSSYPYFSGATAQNGTCKFNVAQTNDIAIRIASTVALPYGDQLALKTAVATIGPIAVAVDASNWGSYRTGIFAYASCRNDYVNHAVLVVGYGTNAAGVDYWIVKNQWGTWWGDKGYILLPRNVTAANRATYSECSVSNWASYVVLA